MEFLNLFRLFNAMESTVKAFHRDDLLDAFYSQKLQIAIDFIHFVNINGIPRFVDCISYDLGDKGSFLFDEVIINFGEDECFIFRVDNLFSLIEREELAKFISKYIDGYFYYYDYGEEEYVYQSPVKNLLDVLDGASNETKYGGYLVSKEDFIKWEYLFPREYAKYYTIKKKRSKKAGDELSRYISNNKLKFSTINQYILNGITRNDKYYIKKLYSILNGQDEKFEYATEDDFNRVVGNYIRKNILFL